jgi:membrane associated rhomboid family serine protease
MIPIKDNIPSLRRPYASWGIIAVCIGIFLLMKLMPLESQRQLTYLYGMVPIRYSNPQWAASFGLPPDRYLSFVTNLFLHGGWVHITLNMWFIWIFAKSIEDRMGHVQFLFFYLCCGLFATFTQWYFDKELVHPVVGASGAIAGILGAYFFLYPYARIVIWFPFLFLPIFFELPAISFLGFWIIMQAYKAMTVLVFEGAVADVAWWAHLGGFVAGGFLYPLFLKNQDSNEDF